VDENNVKKYLILLENIAQHKETVLAIELDDILQVILFFLFYRYVFPTV
jgi:hypothetical protein